MSVYGRGSGLTSTLLVDHPFTRMVGELGLRALPTEGLQVFAGYRWVDIEVEDFWGDDWRGTSDLELELQGIYQKGIFVPQKLGAYVAKKRYALIDRKGNMVIRGLETVRRDWCNLARNLQRDIIKLILTGKEKEAVRKVRETVKRVKTRNIEMKDIMVTTQLGKPLEEYKATSPHIAVARKLENAGHEVHEGSFISFVITKGVKETTSKARQSISERAEPIDKVTIKDYDVDYYLNNQIISVALRVLQVLGYKQEDFLEHGLKKFEKKTK